MKFALVFLAALCHLGLALDYYPIIYNNLGCWADQADRAIRTREGHSFLKGPYQKRKLPIQACGRVANSFNNDMFAVQNGGWCASSPYARKNYRKYGRSKKCRQDGAGGPWANQVYEIKKAGKVRAWTLGCWRDVNFMAVPTMEGRISTRVYLRGNYKRRDNALAQCVAAGYAAGYNVIALQDGGKCMGSRTAKYTYKRFGASKACVGKWNGGKNANKVYAIKVDRETFYY